MSHINIVSTTNKVYWILHNLHDNRYLSGITEIGQVTEGNHDWEIHLSTTNQGEWETECQLLNIDYET